MQFKNNSFKLVYVHIPSWWSTTLDGINYQSDHQRLIGTYGYWLFELWKKITLVKIENMNLLLHSPGSKQKSRSSMACDFNLLLKSVLNNSDTPHMDRV